MVDGNHPLRALEPDLKGFGMTLALSCSPAIFFQLAPDIVGQLLRDRTHTIREAILLVFGMNIWEIQ